MNKIDWSKVAVDTPVEVSIDGVVWRTRYFAKYEHGLVFVWFNGETSASATDMMPYEIVRLAGDDHGF